LAPQLMEPCLADCYRVRNQPLPATSVLTCRASLAVIWNATGKLLQNSRRSPPAKVYASAIGYCLGDGQGKLHCSGGGARTRAQLAESLGALQVKLSAEEIAALEAAVPVGAVAGTRYDAAQMRVLDSEK